MSQNPDQATRDRTNLSGSTSGLSAFASGAGERLLVAAVLAAAIWALILWAMA